LVFTTIFFLRGRNWKFKYNSGKFYNSKGYLQILPKR